MESLTFDTALKSSNTLARPSIAPRAHVEIGVHDFTMVRDRAGFDALEGEWNALFERAGRGEQMFQQYNWLWHWANHYAGQDTEFAIVVGRRNGAIEIIWPAVVERPARLRQLAFMGAPVSQYGDVLVDDISDRNECILAAWAFLVRETRPDLIRLAKVRADAAIAPVLDQLGFEAVSAEEAPHIRMQDHGTYEQFEKRFSTKYLKNRRRQQRRLEERGTLEVRSAKDGSEAADAIRAGLTFKRAWLNAKGQMSRAFADTRVDAFFVDAITSRTHPAGVSTSILASAGELADMNIAITCKGRTALHVMAYSLKFDRFGPGSIHLARHVEQAFAAGITHYDFLAPRHEYKMEWADHVTVVADYVRPVSPMGKAYARIYLATIREGVKRGVKALPRSLARLFAASHSSVGV